MNVNEQQPWQERLNEKIKQSSRRSTYTKVLVLTLYWEDEEPGFKDEGIALTTMF